MWRLHWREEFPFPQGIWILPWEIHFISHSKRHEGKLFPRQTLQGIKFLPTEDIPNAKARCQSFFSGKSLLTPNLDMAKVMPREEFLNALWLLPKYTISVISKKKSAQNHSCEPGVAQGPFPYSLLILPHRQKKFHHRQGCVLSFYLKPVFKSVPSLYLLML